MMTLLLPVLYSVIAILVCVGIALAALRYFAGPSEIKLYCCETRQEYEPGCGCGCEGKRA